MFQIFKKDPVKQLQKKHKALLEEAYRLSTIDRKKSDEARTKADEVERQILSLLEKKQNNLDRED